MARRHWSMVGEPRSAEAWDRVTGSQFLEAALEHQFRADLSRGGRRRVRLLACAVARSGADVLPADALDLVEQLECVADRRHPAHTVTRLAPVTRARAREAYEALAAWQTAHMWQPHPEVLVRADLSAAAVNCLTDPRPTLHTPGLLSTSISGLRSLAAGTYGTPGSDRVSNRIDRHYARLILCLFGNPFRPVTADPRWLTSTVVHLARGIYDDRAFDRLPVLADALQDAGCEDEQILTHLRGPGPHARGCWVVDLVLGKS